MSLISLADVKCNGLYDYQEIVDPTNAELQPDYINGESWLNTVTGESFMLTDQVTGTWTRIEKAQDNLILKKIDKAQDLAFRFIGQVFNLDRQAPYTGDVYGFWNREDKLAFFKSEVLFSDFEFVSGTKAITPTTKVYGLPVDWQPGEKIYVYGTKRSKGFYTIATVDEATGELTVTEDILDEQSDGNFIGLLEIPQAFLDTVSEMVYYDVYLRGATGLKSEKIGTYSYTKDIMDVGGIGYPVEIVSNLENYQHIATGGIIYDDL